VRISEGFWIGQHAVTNELYGRFLAEGGAEPGAWRHRRFNAPQQPVVAVSFEDALAFCAWGTKQAGLTGEVVLHLPTEAEWEYAARGEEGRRYPWGDAKPTPERAVFGLEWDKGAPAPVGQRPRGATPLGVHDFAGNVREWCLDGWRDRYPSPSSVDLDPCFRAPGAAPRVVRGGSWDSGARRLRCATRGGWHPEYRSRYLGFRVVCRRFRQHVTIDP
jgi:formylglycine-generating enzyme required for sulfatase activity